MSVNRTQAPCGSRSEVSVFLSTLTQGPVTVIRSHLHFLVPLRTWQLCLGRFLESDPVRTGSFLISFESADLGLLFCLQNLFTFVIFSWLEADYISSLHLSEGKYTRIWLIGDNPRVCLPQDSKGQFFIIFLGWKWKCSFMSSFLVKSASIALTILNEVMIDILLQ